MEHWPGLLRVHLSAAPAGETCLLSPVPVAAPTTCPLPPLLMCSIMTSNLLGLGSRVPKRRDFLGALSGVKFQEHCCLKRRAWIAKSGVSSLNQTRQVVLPKSFYFLPSQLSLTPGLSDPHPFTCTSLMSILYLHFWRNIVPL